MSDTPTLAALIQSYIDDTLLGTNIAMPAIVRSYDAETRTATVQPTINNKVDDGYEQLPLMQEVPVLMLGGRNSWISIPLQAGDMVLLVFSQKSLDAWLDSKTGEPSDPRDDRVNHIYDAVAIPGLFPFSLSQQSSGSAVDLVIINKAGTAQETKISLKENGQIHLGDNGEFIAREGDPVQVTIPSGTFLVSADAGVLNPSPVNVTGTITSGSSNNKSS